MYHVTIQQGPARGATWALIEGAYQLGRSAECDIVIAGDSAVSRRQCELCIENGNLLLRNLSDRSVTLLNGDVVTHDSRIRPGDSLTVGFTTLLISSAARGGDAQSSQPADLNTQVLGAEDAVYFGGPKQGADVSRRIESLQDLVELFNLALVFSEATGVDDMARCIRGAIDERFRPQAAWAARLRFSGSGFRILPGSDASEGPAFEKSMRLMMQAFSENRGLLVPEASGAPGARQVRTAMAAPLMVGGTAIGALAVVTETPNGVYEEVDLQYLVALGRLLAPCIVSAEHTAGLVIENERLRASQVEASELVGTSRAMAEVRAQLKQAAGAPLSVLILGESGTGKELAARYLHRLSPVKEGPCIAVNCAAIPPELLESELFGHEKGAFTGAAGRRIGLVEQAQGGTLFLDEIGDLSLENQARLLRVLEDGSFRRLGGREEIKVSFRLIAATNMDVAGLVAQGRFRSDLYHRINTFEVVIPPLRERPSDIPVLVEHFLNLAQSHANRPLRGIAPEALEQLKRATWPGNVRELRNALYRAVHVAQDDMLTMVDFAPRKERERPASDVPLISIDEAEKRHIAAVLEACGGDVDKAGPILGVARSTLYKKIKKFDIAT